MPPKDLKVSVFRTGGLKKSQTWELADREVISKQNPKRTLYGSAELTPLTVNKVGLKLIPDDKPKRHANITGWPPEKDEQKMLAIELADKSSLKLKKEA